MVKFNYHASPICRRDKVSARILSFPLICVATIDACKSPNIYSSSCNNGRRC